MVDPWMLAADYVRRWGAAPTGPPFMTATSVLAPAVRDGEPVMLKVAVVAEERRGNALLAWWAGRGAARVLEHDETAVLMERAVGPRSLSRMADEDDDGATRALCRVAARLHAIDEPPPPGAVPLDEWFAELFRHADEVGGFHARTAEVAADLLAERRETVVLHGDLHHGNVLDFGAERHPATDGWLAIDPKHLAGDRVFDFTNILCNPTGRIATRAGRLSRQIDVIGTETGIGRTRLLRWTVAWCGLSSAWIQRDAAADRHRPDVSPTGASTLAVGREAERLLAEAG